MTILLIPCFASDTAVGCELHASWRIDTGGGPIPVCDKHLQLVTIKLERAGLEPRVRPLELDGRAVEIEASLH